MRRRSWALQAVLMLGCRSNTEELEPSVALEPSVVLEQEPAEQPKPAPIEAPTAQPEPEPEPDPTPTSTWRPTLASTRIEAKPLRRTATTARFTLADQQLHYRLDLRLRERSTKLTLTDRDTKHTLVHQSSLLHCDHEYTWIGTSLRELAHDAHGRKLLELWVACTLGEDILFNDSLMLLVLVDADGLSALWSHIAYAHFSHVCGAWDDLDVSFGREELIVSKSDVAKIFLPEDIPGYDCDEDSREYVIPREQHRVRLP